MAEGSNGTILECRELFARVPIAIMQRVPQGILDIQPRVFRILATKKDLKESMLTAASCSFTLPMPVHTSPLITLLKSDPNAQENLWHPRYVPFSDSFAELGQLFTATLGGIYGTDEVKVQQVLQQFSQEGERQADQLTEDLCTIATSKELTEQDRISQFLSRLEMATIQVLNRYETFLHTCLIGDENVPLALCLTPMVFPTLSQIHPDKRNDFFDRLTQYWMTKVDGTNEKLEADAKVQPQEWLTTEGLRQAHTQVAPEQLWRGYLTPKTASEYMAYFAKIMEQ